ncbi:rhodanese-like domain-containing protein [Pareuzebyella sediminis]|uniref:rhodanese-like domain-containing protein n=1 Tax=Pareuzebyella sediminis TaxID=2607998 RepID=UPI0011EF2543|nr:rhodanese-like domain-containing protein [Pareuzebyella sediminis]
MSILSTIFGVKNKSSEKITILDKSDYAKAIENKVQLVDVRTPSEYNNGHIKKAINIDYYDPIGFQKAFEKLDKTKPLYIYCRSGARSQKAAHKLVGLGFIHVYDLKGGYMQWS